MGNADPAEGLSSPDALASRLPAHTDGPGKPVAERIGRNFAAKLSGVADLALLGLGCAECPQSRVWLAIEVCPARHGRAIDIWTLQHSLHYESNFEHLFAAGS